LKHIKNFVMVQIIKKFVLVFAMTKVGSAITSVVRRSPTLYLFLWLRIGGVQ